MLHFNKQFTYALLAERAPHARMLARDEALAELTMRYFMSHGPATIQDFVWWSGLTVVDAKAGLAMVTSHLQQETVFHPLSLHSCAAQRERGWRNDHERAVEDQNQGCELCDARPQREDLFRKDQGSEERHRRDVHHAQGKKKYEEQPVTSQTVDAMLQIHAKGASAPLAQNRWHFSPTRVNGCPAFAVYHTTGLGGTFRAFGIQVVTLDDYAPGLLIADVTTFLDPSLLPFFGFPPELPR